MTLRELCYVTLMELYYSTSTENCYITLIELCTELTLFE